MHRKTLEILSLTALATMAFAGTSFAKDGPLTIGMTFQEMNNPYFVSMQKALKTAAGSIDAKLVITDAHHDVTKQISDVEDMIQRGINILLVNPADSVGIKTAVEEAHKAGITIVAVDANADGPVDSFVGSKNEEAGYLSCKYLGKAIGEKGNVAILDGIPVVPILQRVEGCVRALKEFPNVKVVDKQNGKQERATALSVTENMIEAHPDLKGIFSVNDVGAMGSLSAIQASGKDIKLTSVDGAPDAVKAIAAGGPFIETTAQFPRDMVRIGLGIALAKYWGANVPKAVPIDVKVVDKSDAKSFSW